ncbi:hypothetical protein Tco_0638230 [Tanacetum coccineum]
MSNYLRIRNLDSFLSRDEGVREDFEMKLKEDSFDNSSAVRCIHFLFLLNLRSYKEKMRNIMESASDKDFKRNNETDKEESVEAMNPIPLTTKSDSVVGNAKVCNVNKAPEDDHNGQSCIWSDLRTMFDPPSQGREQAIWKPSTTSTKEWLCLEMIEKQAGIEKVNEVTVAR